MPNPDLFSPETRPSNLKQASGTHTTVTASDTVKTGLRTVTRVLASFEDDPVDDPMHVNAKPSATDGSINIKTWKNTGGTDPTPLAATTFGKKIVWIAWGY